jgi:hypothetical protein
LDDLQFQKAEFHDNRPACAMCKSAVEGSYYQFAGTMICVPCGERVRAGQREPGNAHVLRGLAFGAGAAAACSVAYAVITALSGLEIALVAILVGYLVGRAVRIGSSGLGGRRCQVLAVGLTYFSITGSYLLLALREPGAEAVRNLGGVVMMTGIALASPLLGLAGGFGGILGLAIIVFGLMQAWRQTAPDPRILTGPFALRINV